MIQVSLNSAAIIYGFLPKIIFIEEFKTMDLVEKHVKSDHDKIFKCDLCEKGDFTSRGLKTHRTRVHTGPNAEQKSLKDKVVTLFKHSKEKALKNKKLQIKEAIAAGGSECGSIKKDYIEYEENQRNRSSCESFLDIFKVQALDQPSFKKFRKKT